MKAMVIKLLALLILIILSSCSTRKLNKQKFESSSSVQSEIRMQDFRNDKLEAKRKILLTDITNEQYSVIIFPADSFSFSAQHGFKGKAEKIEVRGLISRVQARLDSTVVKEEQQSGRAYEVKQRIEKSEKSRIRFLETKRWSLTLLLIVLTGIILIGWWLRRWVM